MIDLPELLAQLAVQRPVFHSEDDFKFALAWLIQQTYPNYSVRLEYKPPFLADRIYIDLWIKDGRRSYGIEMKYKTATLSTTIGDEAFDLSDHNARDQARYDFLFDIQRLESLVHANHEVVGSTIFLSNDRLFWEQPRNGDTVDTQFRIHDGREIHGELRWHERAAAGTIRDREMPINIRGNYTVSWSYFSKPSEDRNGLFQYALLDIRHDGHGR